MANLKEKLTIKITEIEKQLKGFEGLKPGSEERKDYLRREIGEAKTYLTKLLIFLREVRAELNIKELNTRDPEVEKTD